jgi:hypothetical protein
MELHLKFQPEDFNSFKTFEKAVQKQLGNNIYVGTNSLCLYFDYPTPLVSMLRPNPPQQQFEFVLESSKPQ